MNSIEDISGIVTIDKRVANAIEAGRGIKFTAQQLDVLVNLGLIEIISSGRDRYLKEIANCRRKTTQSMNEAPSASAGTERKMENFGHRILQSSGMSRAQAACEAELRARSTFR